MQSGSERVTLFSAFLLKSSTGDPDFATGGADFVQFWTHRGKYLISQMGSFGKKGERRTRRRKEEENLIDETEPEFKI